jgi:hypothetical protein
MLALSGGIQVGGYGARLTWVVTQCTNAARPWRSRSSYGRRHPKTSYKHSRIP